MALSWDQMPSDRRNQSAPPADPSKFAEAIEAFRRRDPITDDQLAVLTEAERQRAFWVAGVADADLVQQVYDEIDRAISDGTTLEDFRGVVGDKLYSAWGAEDAPRVETVFRTNLSTAYNAGRSAVMTDPAVLEARPYWRYDRMSGADHSHDEPGHICGVMDGVVRPADDPIWQKAHPPCHHRCGCHLTPLSRSEAFEEGVSRAPYIGDGPADGFGRPPAGPAEDQWVPDIAAYAPPIRDSLRKKLAG